jgi:hypothetical protein
MTDIKNCVVEKLKEIDISKFRTSPDLVLIVCNIVWNACTDLKIKEDVDKKQLVLDILQPILNYTPAETQIVKQQIEYCINHNQIILIKNSTKLFKSAWKFLKKKVV